MLKNTSNYNGLSKHSARLLLKLWSAFKSEFSPNLTQKELARNIGFPEKRIAAGIKQLHQAQLVLVKPGVGEGHQTRKWQLSLSKEFISDIESWIAQSSHPELVVDALEANLKTNPSLKLVKLVNSRMKHTNADSQRVFDYAFLAMLLMQTESDGVVRSEGFSKIGGILPLTTQEVRARVELFQAVNILSYYLPGFNGVGLFGRRTSVLVLNVLLLSEFTDTQAQCVLLNEPIEKDIASLLYIIRKHGLMIQKANIRLASQSLAGSHIGFVVHSLAFRLLNGAIRSLVENDVSVSYDGLISEIQKSCSTDLLFIAENLATKYKDKIHPANNELIGFIAEIFYEKTIDIVNEILSTHTIKLISDLLDKKTRPVISSLYHPKFNKASFFVHEKSDLISEYKLLQKAQI